MPDKHRTLLTSIESIVGAGHVTDEPSLKVDGLSPLLLAQPGSADEAAASETDPRRAARPQRRREPAPASA